MKNLHLDQDKEKYLWLDFYIKAVEIPQQKFKFRAKTDTWNPPPVAGFISQGFIYSQNIVCNLHENLKILPIGMANSQWRHGNISAMIRVIESDIIQNNHIYFNFNVNIKDYMYVINNNTLINYTKISKFLIPIAETQLLYKKL